MTDVDLNFLAHQIERLITEVSSLRDEVRVQGAMLMRLDTHVSGVDTGQNLLLDELRAIRNQINRMNDRIRKLEDSES
jgi:chromosome segregation ATPase